MTYGCTYEIYDRYLRHLTGCADFFRRGISDIGQLPFAA